MKETISRYEVDSLADAMVAARDCNPILPSAVDPKVNVKIRRAAEIAVLGRVVIRELDRRGLSHVAVGRHGREIVWWPSAGHVAVIDVAADRMTVDDLPVDVSGMSVASAVDAADAMIAASEEVIA